MLKTFIYLFSLTILISSCQTVQYVPVSYTAEKPAETIATVADDKTEIFVEHLSRDGGQLVFDMDVWNNSPVNIRLNPNATVIFGSNEPFPAPETANIIEQATVHATDKGKFASTREDVNQYFKQKVRSQQAAQVALFLVGVALAVNDAVSDSKDARQEFWTQQDERRAAIRDITTFTGLVVTDLIGQSLENEKFRTFEDLEYLPEEYLNEGMIFPGSHSRGKVFFRYPTDFKYYRIIVPVEGLQYIFDFRKPTSGERQALKRIQAF